MKGGPTQALHAARSGSWTARHLLDGDARRSSPPSNRLEPPLPPLSPLTPPSHDTPRQMAAAAAAEAAATKAAAAAAAAKAAAAAEAAAEAEAEAIYDSDSLSSYGDD